MPQRQDAALARMAFGQTVDKVVFRADNQGRARFFGGYAGRLPDKI